MTTSTHITEGSILVEIWGNEQTNADFFRVEKRTPKTVVLTRLERISQIDGTLTGTAVPGKPLSGPTLRRKVIFHQGMEMANGESGILRLWDQRPVRISSYA